MGVENIDIWLVKEVAKHKYLSWSKPTLIHLFRQHFRVPSLAKVQPRFYLTNSFIRLSARRLVLHGPSACPILHPSVSSFALQNSAIRPFAFRFSIIMTHARATEEMLRSARLQ